MTTESTAGRYFVLFTTKHWAFVPKPSNFYFFFIHSPFTSVFIFCLFKTFSVLLTRELVTAHNMVATNKKRMLWRHKRTLIKSKAVGEVLHNGIDVITFGNERNESGNLRNGNLPQVKQGIAFNLIFFNQFWMKTTYILN